MMIFGIYFSTSPVLKLGRQALFEHTSNVSCVFWHLLLFTGCNACAGSTHVHTRK